MQSANCNLVIGIVTSLDDPDRLGRVKVKYPYLSDEKSHWARLVTPMAGKNRGLFLRPEINDEVFVAFELNDVRRPYILGSVWSKADPHPPEEGRPTENNWRFIRSRSGHVVKLNDTQGQETIEIIDKSKNNKIIIDTAKNTITVAAADSIKVEAASIEVSGKSDVKISAPQIQVKGDASIKVEAPSIDMKASGQMTVDGGGMLTLKGGLVKIN